MDNPRLVFLAGPNGAGKTTFYESFLKEAGLEFVNADRVVAALGIPAVEAVAVADAVRREFLDQGRSFATETVFSDPVGAKLGFLRDALARGFHVSLYYMGLESSGLSEARIAQRVLEGGHDVPTDRLERRFQQSLRNLAAALKFVTEGRVFDNSAATQPYRLVLSSELGRIKFRTKNLPTWLAGVLADFDKT